MSSAERALDLATDVLAVKRVTRLITEDQITEPLRQAIWSWFGGPESGKGIGYLITCPHCTSVWVSGAVVAARIMIPKVWSPLAEALALSSVTSLIAERE